MICAEIISEIAIVSRGISLIEKTNKIPVETIGFPKDFQGFPVKTIEILAKGVRDSKKSIASFFDLLTTNKLFSCRHSERFNFPALALRNPTTNSIGHTAISHEMTGVANPASISYVMLFNLQLGIKSV